LEEEKRPCPKQNKNKNAKYDPSPLSTQDPYFIVLRETRNHNIATSPLDILHEMAANRFYCCSHSAFTQQLLSLSSCFLSATAFSQLPQQLLSRT
jgi:hypothetical protein